MSTQTTAGTRIDRVEGALAAVDPEPIIRLASGFMAAKHLFAASELGLFEALANSAATVEALAARTGLTRRAARISADAMVALGLLERRGDEYSNTDVAATFLAGSPGPDLRPLLRHWDKNSYPAWSEFAQALGRGPTREIFDVDEEHQKIASAGIEAILAGPAGALSRAFDFSTHRRLLDVGGGTGSWTIATARNYPHLEATVLDRPLVVEVARERVAAAGLASRVTVVAGDAMAEELPPGHDVFLVANLMHYWSPEGNAALLARIRRAAPAGGRLLLADFWTDPTHTKPVQAAVMAGEFAVHLRDGDVYSVEEVQGWMAGTGWRFTTHAPLVGPQSLVVAEAV